MQFIPDSSIAFQASGPSETRLVHEKVIPGKIAIMRLNLTDRECVVEVVRRAVAAKALAIILVNSDSDPGVFPPQVESTELDGIEIPVLCLGSQHGEILRDGAWLDVGLPSDEVCHTQTVVHLSLCGVRTG